MSNIFVGDRQCGRVSWSVVRRGTDRRLESYHGCALKKVHCRIVSCVSSAGNSEAGLSVTAL